MQKQILLLLVLAILPFCLMGAARQTAPVFTEKTAPAKSAIRTDNLLKRYFSEKHHADSKLKRCLKPANRQASEKHAIASVVVFFLGIVLVALLGSGWGGLIALGLTGLAAAILGILGILKDSKTVLSIFGIILGLGSLLASIFIAIISANFD